MSFIFNVFAAFNLYISFNAVFELHLNSKLAEKKSLFALHSYVSMLLICIACSIFFFMENEWKM